VSEMLAARAHQGSSVLALEKTAVPEVGSDDVLIRVHSAGLAPGMLALLAIGAFRHLPTTVGHEASGVVEAVGGEVDSELVGKRVRVHPMLSCRRCNFCRTDREQMCAQSAMIGMAGFGSGQLALYAQYHDGALAEYIRAPHWLVDVLPDNVSFDVAAKIHDLGNAVRALKQTDLPLGGTLVINAATGAMGTATVKLAQFFGAGRLILVGRSAERLDAVRRLAPELPTDVVALEELGAWQNTGGLTQWIRELAPGGADAVTDYVPSGPATGQALTALATGGTLVHMGGNAEPLPLPPAALMLQLWRVVGTRACTRTDTDQVLRLLASGALQADELITHRFALADIDTAVSSLQSRSDPIWMAVVNP
jgi:threonine dehydrogenase-like Zn-dependent dehydrogenase